VAVPRACLLPSSRGNVRLIGWYLAFGWAFLVLWVAAEFHLVHAKRRDGVYPRMSWKEYALVPFALMIGWPWLATSIVRSVIRAWRGWPVVR
jgi:hypothetical protein